MTDVASTVTEAISAVTESLPTLTEPFSPELLPFVIAGFIVAFILAFGVGANDVANSFGTSVGARVLSLKAACILGTIFEVLGAILIGYKVSDTVRKGILDVSLYENDEKELMLGFLAALGGSSVWNLLATALSLPISGTHTIVGATVGFSVCAKGWHGVNWKTFGKIVGSWFVSPLLSGTISATLYIAVRKFILSKDDPIVPGLRSLPIFYSLTVLVNVFSVVHDGPQMLRFDVIPWWGALIISLAVGFAVGVVVLLVVVPRQRKAIRDIISQRNKRASFTFESSESIEMGGLLASKDNSRSPTPPQELATIENGVIRPTTYSFSEGTADPVTGYTPAIETDSGSAESSPQLLSPHKVITILPTKEKRQSIPENTSQLPLCDPKDGISGRKPAESEAPEVGKLFSFLQVLTATFGSFAHGGNDVSNAIGPLIGLWAIYTEGNVGQKSEPPIYILLFGGVGISVGLWVWGRRVIKTIGEDLTKVTPSSGFTIEIGSAFTVLLASKCGLPISTTHCKVGSVVFVGWTKSTKEGVDWSLFRNIVIAWVVTVPLTAALSALLMFILTTAFP